MRTYEELAGAEGRQIFYRAERFRARELFKRTIPDIAIDHTPYTLQDLSLNGLGAATAPGSNDVCQVGEQVSISLGLQGIPLFEGAGQVARVQPMPNGIKVGIRLLDRHLDIPRLVAKYEEAIIRSGLDEDEIVGIDGLVAADYRRLCADLLHLLRSYRAKLDRFSEDRPEPSAAADMLAACEERVLPRWRALWYGANELVRPIMADPAKLHATKQFTELVITPEIMSVPTCRRCYEKPLGYPGDFQIMNTFYAWRYEGETLYDRLVHRISLDIAECIVARMVMMRQAIAETVAKPSSNPARVTSLGCGPAREVLDYLQLRELPRPVQFTLIDQEHAALSYVYGQTYPETIRLGGRASVTCLNASFSRLLKAGELFNELPPQDLIYTAGLIDYLSPRRAKALATSLYARLAPGGALVIGNVRETSASILWPLEFILDWSLVYRDERAMLDLIADLPGVSVETSLDPTGRVVVLRVRKP